MVSAAYRYVRNSQDAEDVASDCWLSIIRHMDTLQKLEDYAIKAYIMRCVHNCSIDYIRRQKRYSCYEHQNEMRSLYLSQIGDEYDWNSPGIDSSIIMLGLSFLPPREAQVLKLKFEMHSTNSIATIMNIAPGTVRKYWFKAKKRIRVLLISQADN